MCKARDEIAGIKRGSRDNHATLFSLMKSFTCTTHQTGARLFHFFKYHEEEFYEHYHKRSNNETVFSMVKSKFGERLRSKTRPAQVNEVLLKMLCHNLCVIVQAIFELGIEPTFWQESGETFRVES